MAVATCLLCSPDQQMKIIICEARSRHRRLYLTPRVRLAVCCGTVGRLRNRFPDQRDEINSLLREQMSIPCPYAPDKGEVGGSSPLRPTIKSPINTQLFLLFRFLGISLQNHFAKN